MTSLLCVNGYVNLMDRSSTFQELLILIQHVVTLLNILLTNAVMVSLLSNAFHRRVAKVNISQALHIKKQKVELLHRRFGHVGKVRMKVALMQQKVMNLRPVDADLLDDCATCAAGKMTWEHLYLSQNRSTVPGEVLCADNEGKSRMRSRNGNYYGNYIVDEASNYLMTKGLPKITDSVQRLRYVARRKFKGKTRLIRTDRGPEWMNFEMEALMDELGCEHQTAATGRHQQNGRAEKAIRDNKDIMRCSLHGSGLTQYVFKDECRNHAAHTKNCMPCMSNPNCKSPWEMLHGTKPDLSKLRAFGEACEVPYTPAARIKNGDMHPRESWRARSMANCNQVVGSEATSCGTQATENRWPKPRKWVPGSSWPRMVAMVSSLPIAMTRSASSKASRSVVIESGSSYSFA